MRSQCAFLMEARIFNLVEYGNFLRAFEGGIVDCGLFLGNELPGGSPIDILFQLQLSCGEEPLIVGLEVKAFVHIAADNAGNVTYYLAFASQAQYDAAEALVITSPSEPDFVALVPMRYIRLRVEKLQEKRKKKNDRYSHEEIFDYHRPLWILHKLPAFCPELRPFMLRAVQLGGALHNMREYAKGNIEEWVNEHTGLSFEVDRPTASPVSILEPTYEPWRIALEAIRVVYRAFAAHSVRFNVQFVEMFPITADFKFLQLSSGIEIFVEAKKCHVDFRLDLGEDSYMRHAQWSTGMKKKIIFSWKAQWDYLYTVNSLGGGTQALFIPRDVIPRSFWNARPEHVEDKLEWPRDDLDVLRECVVHVTDGARLVADVERLLDVTERRTQSVKAQEPVPIVPSVVHPALPAPEVEADDLETDDMATVLQDRPLDSARGGWNSQDYQRGFGSHLHEEIRGMTYENWAKEALTEICRQWGKGLVVDLGKRNTLCRFGIARYNWSWIDNDRYDREGEPPETLGLYKRIPVVALTFLHLSWTFGPTPRGNRPAIFSTRLLAKRPESLVVCDMFPSRCIRFPHTRFVVPNCKLPTNIRRMAPAPLAHGIWDQYRTEPYELTDVLTRALRGPAQIVFSSDSGQTAVESETYCHFLQDALKAGLTDWATTVEETIAE
ncbi:MAG: hypothetical protein LQ337_004410 [Flavoplaca oasis]|nr:MAG: hypothetical protein LQ337_004410 [Flavoplaca oasis]